MRASVGLVGSLLGIAAGGLSAVRFGYFRTLIVGARPAEHGDRGVRHAGLHGPGLRVFGAVMAADNFGTAFAGVALVTYMSSLTTSATRRRSTRC